MASIPSAGKRGIEAIDAAYGNGQPTLWEAVIPECLLPLPGDLGRVDVWLDDPRFFEPFRPFFDPTQGRPSIPMETYLRLMYRGRTTPLPFTTRLFTPGTDVKIDFRYKHSRVKQYLKEGRALRIETVVNKPSDLNILARIGHLPELTARAKAVNHRLFMIERAGQGCAIGSALFERIHQPSIVEGQRTGALRFGDPRAMALTGALCSHLHAVAGFTNASLRGLVAGLLGTDSSRAQMTYDLRRLRLHGLIQRLPHSNTYLLTPEGVRVAIFYTKVHGRILRPLVAAGHQPPAPLELRRALATIDRVISNYTDRARLQPAA